MRLPRPSESSAVRTLIVLILCGLLLWSYPTGSVQAAAGDLDPAFGTGGKVTTDLSEDEDIIHAIVLQSDGKIVAAGESLLVPSGFGFTVARYNANGSLDQSFGSGGSVHTSFFDSKAFAVALQSDGRIVAAGKVFNTSNSAEDFALARYNSDGSLDSTFGTGGKVATDFSAQDTSFDTAVGVAVQTDGKIVAAGERNSQLGISFALARYNSDGSLDSSFGQGGKTTTNFGFAAHPQGLALQPDGKIVVVGFTSGGLGDPPAANLARYNSDGSLDVSFGSGGKVSTSFFALADEIHAVVIQRDGRIVVAGNTVNLNNHSVDFWLVRYKTDGSLDSTFGNGGFVTTDYTPAADPPGSGSDVVFALALQANGKIVAAGKTNEFSGKSSFALARYNPNGSLDAGFGTQGKVTTTFFGRDDRALSVAIQADGQIVAGGTSDNRANDTFRDFALARYLGDPTNFDLCLQDDSNGSLLQFNSTTGAYQFTSCGGFTIGGTGVITRRGGLITLQQNGPDRRVSAKIDGVLNKGTASVQIFSQGTTFTITDRNTLNNTCSCVAN